MSAQDGNLWTNPHIAQLYKTVESVTGPPAEILIRQAGILSHPPPLVILDNACGTGIVTSLLYGKLEEQAKKGMRVVCGDISEGMVKATADRIASEGWEEAEAKVVDGQKTGLPDAFFTHVITNFGVMFMPDPAAALNEISRILKPGGICALSTWATLGWVPDAKAAIATIPGSPPPFPDGVTFMKLMSKGADWHVPGFVQEQLAAHGFEDVQVEVLSTPARSDSAAAFAETLGGIVMQFTKNVWSEENVEKYGPEIKPALQRYMTEKYGDGKPFELEMAPILATARKP